MRVDVETLLAAGQDDAELARTAESIQQKAPPLLAATDEVVEAFEHAATIKVDRLRWIQALFLAAGAALALLGYGLTYRTVVDPIDGLRRAAAAIGEGALAKPIPRRGRDEIGQLAQSLETMREQLRAAHEDLEARVAQRTRELEALYEVSREISARLDITHVLRSVTETARTLLGGEVAFLCLPDQQGQLLQPQAASGPREALLNDQMSLRHPLIEQVLGGREAVRCGGDHCGGPCRVIAAPFQASHLAAPLRVRDRVIGAFCVGSSQPGCFSDHEVRLLTKLATSAALALENARLYEQAERAAALEERQRIAAEMHDGLAQTLSYLGIKAQQAGERVEAGQPVAALAELERISAGIEQAAQEVRQSIASLREETPSRRALQDRLADLVTGFGADGGPPIDLRLPASAPLALTTDDTEQVLRVVGEALLNARRHAGAGRILVQLELQGTDAVVTVEDDGRGFDAAAPRGNGTNHFGLSIMRARASRIGGRLTVDSAPGRGTRVTLTWPLAPAAGLGALR